MRLLKILSVISIAAIILLSFFSWYSADDLCYRNELARSSIFKMAWYQYMHWDGRSLSMAAFVQLFSLKYFPPELVTFLWACSFIGVAVLILKIVRIENPLFCNRQHALIATAIIAATCWLGMWKSLPDIVYWPTGGSYSFMNLVGFFWLSVFLSDLNSNRFSPGRRWLLFIFSFVCGINSHNFMTGLIVIVLIEWGYYRFVRNDKAAGLYIACSLIGLLAGTSIVFFAPGNDVRLSAISYQGLNSHFLFFYFLVLAKYCYWLLSLIALLMMIAGLSGKNNFFQKENFVSGAKEFLSFMREKKSILIMLHRHKFLLAAGATAVIFSATPFFATPRTGIFFGTFLVIYFFQRGWKEEWKMDSARFIYGSIFFLSIFLSIIFFQLFRAQEIRHQLAEREQIYTSHKGMDVAVAPISKADIPFAFLFTDIRPDSSYWVNRCVALHYELKTVRIVTGN